jgi:uncharacterized protein
MSVTTKAVVFLMLAFAISWAIALGGHFAGFKATLGALPILVAMMTGPSISAFICALGFEKGARIRALGLSLKPNLWWLVAWLAPVAIAAMSVAAGLMLNAQSLVNLDEALVSAAAEQSAEQAEQLRQIPSIGLIYLAGGVTIGALINTFILTFTEELGWRGYLHFLWRPSGFWRASIGTGLVWGVWHLPAILFYDLNYPDHPFLGAGLFVLWCVLLSPIMALIRDRSHSVWAAGLFHGTLNAIGGFTTVVVNNPAFPWNGIVGIGGFIALALGVVVVFFVRRGANAQSPER